MKKLFLSIAVFLCFYLSADRVVQFITGHVPPGKVGECLLLHYPEKQVEVKIISNDKKNKLSMVAYKVYGEYLINQYISFDDLRALKAKRINCEKTN